MKLTIKRDELVSKLSIVSRAVSTRAATQALSGILISASEAGVMLAGFPPMACKGSGRQFPPHCSDGPTSSGRLPFW